MVINMKKRLSLFMILVVIFFTPIFVKAENRIYFDMEESKIAPGEKKELKIKVDSDEDFTKVNFDLITTSTYVGFYSVDFSENFVRNASSQTGSNYELEAKTPMKSGTTIGTVTLIAKESSPIGIEGYIRLTRTSITTSSLMELKTTEVKMIVSNEKSNNNNLSSLSSNLVDIDFNKDVLEYVVLVDNDVDTFDLSAQAEDSSSTVTISDQKLKKKENIINVTVTSEDGAKKTYKVTVNKKEDNKSKTTINEKKENEEGTDKNAKSGFISVLILLIMVLVVDLLYIKKKK